MENRKTYRRVKLVAKVRSACQTIGEHEDVPALNYCTNYARWGLICPATELPVQVPYILNNMTHWRGDVAKDVRATLKQCLKEFKELEV